MLVLFFIEIQVQRSSGTDKEELHVEAQMRHIVGNLGREGDPQRHLKKII